MATVLQRYGRGAYAFFVVMVRSPREQPFAYARQRTALKDTGGDRHFQEITMSPAGRIWLIAWFLVAITGAIVVLRSARPAEAQTVVESPSRWVGRTEPATRRFGWPGSGFEIAFVGSELSVTLQTDASRYLTVISGEQHYRLKLKPGTNDYRVLQSLGSQPHLVRVIVSSEGASPVTFLNGTIDGELSSAPAPGRKLLVIGDSISAGYGVLGDDARCVPRPDNQDFDRTYGAALGRRFDAEVVAAAFSGNGLVRNYNDVQRATMSTLYSATLPDGRRQAPDDDADVVMILLGTNDWTQGSRPPSFVGSYIDLLTDLRGANPRAQIYALIGPLLQHDDLASARSAIQSAVEARRLTGDRRVAFVDLGTIKASFGCNWHPDAGMHLAIADVIASHIKSDLQW